MKNVSHITSPRTLACLALSLALGLLLSSQAAELKFSLAASEYNSQLGSDFAVTGDLNGDDIPDLAVADPRYRGGGTTLGSGIVYIVSGADGSLIRNYEPVPAPSQAFGTALAALDADGDAVLDLAIGAPGQADITGFGAGSVSIYSGTDGSLLSVTIGPSRSQYGSALANAGDQDGDGRDDLFVGAPNADASRGAVFIQSGVTGDIIQTIPSGASTSAFGVMVATLGDIDGDGRADAAIGAPNFRVGGNPVGRVSLIRSSDGKVLAEAVGNGFYNSLGQSLAPAADADDDGLPDLLVGSFSGGTILLLSGADLSLIADLSIPGLPAFQRTVVGGSLDLDHDGTDDWLIGSPGLNFQFSPARGGIRIISGADRSELFAFDADAPFTHLGLKHAVLPGIGFAAGEPSKLDPLTGGRGLAHAWAVGRPDSDGDGIPDDEDPFPSSILDLTVILFGSDSGVENRTDETGTSLADLLGSLPDPEELGNPGRYLSNLNDYFSELEQSGWITDAEARDLRLAAVKALAGSKAKSNGHDRR